MPLRRSPCLTTESLAARCANALHSTGPRTPRGKARVSFNALKHGQYAARSARLRERLIRAGYEPQEELYGRIRSKIAQTFGTPDRKSRQDADRLANVVWCRATRPLAVSKTLDSQRDSSRNHGSPVTDARQLPEGVEEASIGTKLESFTKQRDSQYRVSSGQWERSASGQPSVVSGFPDGQHEAPFGRLSEEPNWRRSLRHSGSFANSATLGCHLGGEPRLVRFKFGVRDDWRRIGLIFWVQRKAYFTVERFVRVLVGSEMPSPPAGHQGLERALRSKAFRLRKPNPRERWRYSLDSDGKPDWSREPWKSSRARVEAAERLRRR